MPLQELITGPSPAREDVQQTSFSYDVLGRYMCNNWQEITAAQGQGRTRSTRKHKGPQAAKSIFVMDEGSCFS
jgi:hypothetical protein